MYHVFGILWVTIISRLKGRARYSENFTSNVQFRQGSDPVNYFAINVQREAITLLVGDWRGADLDRKDCFQEVAVIWRVKWSIGTAS